MAVDHPAGTEVFVDERFADARARRSRRSSPARCSRWPRHATIAGRTSASCVAAQDDRHLDFAGRGAYQGITRPHAIELTLPDDGAAHAVRSGWSRRAGCTRPTARSTWRWGRARHAPPQGLALEAATGDGPFRSVRAGLGFPSGKDKTVLLDLAGVFPAGAAGPRRLRLSDEPRDLLGSPRLGGRASRRARRAAPPADAGGGSALSRLLGGEPVGAGLARAAALRARRHGAALARPRGLPHALRRRARAAAGGRRPLRDHERRRRDRACASARRRRRRPGMVRDFILVGDGWVKDGDFNTTFSRTVLPLPTHASGRYTTPPRHARGRPRLPAASRRLRDVSHALRRAGPAAGARALTRRRGDRRPRSTDDERVFATASRPAVRGAARHAVADSPLSRRDRARAVGRAPPPTPQARYGFALTESAKAAGHRLRARGSDARREAGAHHAAGGVDGRRPCPSSTSTPTATPTSTSPTARKARRTACIATRATARSRTSPSALGLAALNEPGTGVSMGSVVGRLRQRRLRGPAVYTVGQAGAVPQRRRQGLHARQRARRPAGVGQHQRRDLARLRSRRPARFVHRRLLRRAASTSGSSPSTKIMPESFEYANNGGRKYLYRNLGGGRFEEVSAKVGLTSTRWALAAVAADLRGTGYPDLFIANDYGVSELFVNEGGTVPRGRQGDRRRLRAEERHERLGRRRAEPGHVRRSTSRTSPRKAS